MNSPSSFWYRIVSGFVLFSVIFSSTAFAENPQYQRSFGIISSSTFGDQHYFGGEKNVPIAQFDINTYDIDNIEFESFYIMPSASSIKAKEVIKNIRLVDKDTQNIIAGPFNWEITDAWGQGTKTYWINYILPERLFFSKNEKRTWLIIADVDSSVSGFAANEWFTLGLDVSIEYPAIEPNYDYPPRSGWKGEQVSSTIFENGSSGSVGETSVMVVLGPNSAAISNLFLQVWPTSGLNAQRYFGGEKNVPIAQFQLNSPDGDITLEKIKIDPTNGQAFGVVKNLRLVDYPTKQILTNVVDWDPNDSYRASFDFPNKQIIKQGGNLIITLIADIDPIVSGWAGSWCFIPQISTASDIVAYDPENKIPKSSGFPVDGSRICLGKASFTTLCNNEVSYESWEPQPLATGSGETQCALTKMKTCNDFWVERNLGYEGPPIYSKEGCEANRRQGMFYQDVAMVESADSKKLSPAAGYEDEVIVNPVAQINPFPDTDISKLEGQAAMELYRRAVLGGFPDGEFKGDRSVNRAELAKFLLKAHGIDTTSFVNPHKFLDIKSGEWYERFVVIAEQEGIVSGYSDGTFKPADTVNVAEFLKMLALTFDLEQNLNYSYSDVDSQAWFTPYVGIAQKYKLFPNSSSNLQPGKKLTRDEVAVAIYQFLKNR